MSKTLDKLSDYYTRGNQILKIDLNSNYLKHAINEAIKYVEQKTKYSLDTIRSTNNAALRDIVYVYLTEFSVLYFMDRSGNDNKRNEIVNNGFDLGIVLENKAGFCREISCFMHIVLMYYGINTFVVTGNLGNGGAHVWLISGGGSRIIDPTYKKGITTPLLYDAKEIKRQQLVTLR